MNAPADYLSVRQVAARTGLSITTVYSRIRVGDLAAVRLAHSNRLRIREDAVEAMFDPVVNER